VSINNIKINIQEISRLQLKS